MFFMFIISYWVHQMVKSNAERQRDITWWEEMQIDREGKSTSGKSVSDRKELQVQGERNQSMTWVRELKDISRRSGGRLKKERQKGIAEIVNCGSTSLTPTHIDMTVRFEMQCKKDQGPHCEGNVWLEIVLGFNYDCLFKNIAIYTALYMIMWFSSSSLEMVICRKGTIVYWF